MTSDIAQNRDRWEAMFRWVNARGGRKYPNETAVIWLLGYARTAHADQRILDLGCGWSQSLMLFLNEGFEYWGVDVTDRGFLSNHIVASERFRDRVHLSVFEPPTLEFPDAFFSHLVSTEAIHLNPTPDALSTMIRECHRVLQPDGRLLATVMRPSYWFLTCGYADWTGPSTIRINDACPEEPRRGAQYFVFRDETEIRTYFSDFSQVHVGQELRRFGEDEEKMTDYWIISASK
jgi:ubiquinone/menaquinone biosynthesis C-methylase UbiE